MKCYSIEGNRQWLDGGAMFGNTPKRLWSRWVEVDGFNRIPLACRALLLQTNDITILFETGIGQFMEPQLAERYGVEGNGNLLIENLDIIGFQEKDIDYIILSHLHFDHAGGLVPVWPGIQQSGWMTLFPKAKYVVGKAQFERSLTPHLRDRASFIPGLSEKLQNSGRLILIDDNQTEIDALKGVVTFLFTNGHTPGLMHSLICGDNRTIFFASDLVPGTAWLHLPTVMGYDRWPELTVNEKKVILEKAITENWLLFYTHDACCAASLIFRDEQGKIKEKDCFSNFQDLCF